MRDGRNDRRSRKPRYKPDSHNVQTGDANKKGSWPQGHLETFRTDSIVTGDPRVHVNVERADMPPFALYTRPNMMVCPITGPYFNESLLELTPPAFSQPVIDDGDPSTATPTNMFKGDGTSADPFIPLNYSREQLAAITITGKFVTRSFWNPGSLFVNPEVDQSIAAAIHMKCRAATRFRMFWSHRDLMYYTSVVAWIIAGYATINNMMEMMDSRLENAYDFERAWSELAADHASTDIPDVNSVGTDFTAAVLKRIRALMRGVSFSPELQKEIEWFLQWRRATADADAPVVAYAMSHPVDKSLTDKYDVSKGDILDVRVLADVVEKFTDNIHWMRISADLETTFGDGFKVNLSENGEGVASYDSEWSSHWQNSGILHESMMADKDDEAEAITSSRDMVYPSFYPYDGSQAQYIPMWFESAPTARVVANLVCHTGVNEGPDEMSNLANLNCFWLGNIYEDWDSAGGGSPDDAMNLMYYGKDLEADPQASAAANKLQWRSFPDITKIHGVATDTVTSFGALVYSQVMAERFALGNKCILQVQSAAANAGFEGIMPFARPRGTMYFADAFHLSNDNLYHYRAKWGLPTS